MLIGVANSKYSKGYKLENYIANVFKKRGHYSVRVAGSHSIADVIVIHDMAVKDNLYPTQVSMIQCKTTKKWPISIENYRREKNVKLLEEAKYGNGVDKLLIIKSDYKPLMVFWFDEQIQEWKQIEWIAEMISKT